MNINHGKKSLYFQIQSFIHWQISDMNNIYLFALFFAVASANIAVEDASFRITRNTLSCFACHNITWVILYISDQDGSINKDFLNTFTNAIDRGITTVDAALMVNDTFIPEEFSANVTHALPASFNGTVWLRVYDSKRLWSQDVSQRIPYFEKLVLAFKQRGVKVGIYSRAKEWASVFGSQGAGSDILEATSIWYANYNNVKSFSDFSYAAFGTWD